jgi:DNA-binding transcriptional MocR family regulator
MALWARVDGSLPVSAFLEEASRRGVLFQPGKQFTWAQRETQHVSLGYGALTEREMSIAVARLTEAARAVVRSPRSPLIRRGRSTRPSIQTK